MLADPALGRPQGLWRFVRLLNMGIDTSEPGGKLVYDVLAAVAAMEREHLIERTHSGLAAARARGRKGGRKREFSEAKVRRAVRSRDRQGVWHQSADALQVSRDRGELAGLTRAVHKPGPIRVDDRHAHRSGLFAQSVPAVAPSPRGGGEG